MMKSKKKTPLLTKVLKGNCNCGIPKRSVFLDKVVNFNLMIFECNDCHQMYTPNASAKEQLIKDLVHRAAELKIVPK